MMGIGIPISQSKRPLPIVFSSLVCPENVRSESKVPAATWERTVEAYLMHVPSSSPTRRVLSLPRRAPGSRSDALALAAATRAAT